MAHPSRVALGEIVVDGYELDVLAGKRVQIQRQRSDERLTFARLHFGNGSAVQNDAADKLNIERNHVPGKRMTADLLGRSDQMAARVLNESERLREERVKTFALLIARLELLGHTGEILVGKILGLITLFNTVNLMNNGPNLLKLAIVLSAEK